MFNCQSYPAWLMYVCAGGGRPLAHGLPLNSQIGGALPLGYACAWAEPYPPAGRVSGLSGESRSGRLAATQLSSVHAQCDCGACLRPDPPSTHGPGHGPQQADVHAAFMQRAPAGALEIPGWAISACTRAGHGHGSAIALGKRFSGHRHGLLSRIHPR